MGPQETNLVFDIWTGNATDNGKRSPIHEVFAQKYRSRNRPGSDAFQVCFYIKNIIKKLKEKLPGDHHQPFLF